MRRYKTVGRIPRPHDCRRDSLPTFMGSKWDHALAGEILRCDDCGTHWVCTDGTFQEFRRARERDLQPLLDDQENT